MATIPSGRGAPSAAGGRKLAPPVRGRIRRRIFGDPKDPLSPGVFHQLSLVAFLAWVGLGADGLSSSCYGPEEAFLHLGSERFLALFLVLAMAFRSIVVSLTAAISTILSAFVGFGVLTLVIQEGYLMSLNVE